MPSTSDAMRDYWGGVDDQPAIQHLRSRGFKDTDDWRWTPPPNHTWSARDMNALIFLVEEWDWGGLTSPIVLMSENFRCYCGEDGVYRDKDKQ